jgi:hypothetical protein
MYWSDLEEEQEKWVKVTEWKNRNEKHTRVTPLATIEGFHFYKGNPY